MRLFVGLFQRLQERVRRLYRELVGVSDDENERATFVRRKPHAIEHDASHLLDPDPGRFGGAGAEDAPVESPLDEHNVRVKGHVRLFAS